MINWSQVSRRYGMTSQVSGNYVCDTRKLDLCSEFRKGPSQIGAELSQTTSNAKVVPVRIGFGFKITIVYWETIVGFRPCFRLWNIPKIHACAVPLHYHAFEREWWRQQSCHGQLHIWGNFPGDLHKCSQMPVENVCRKCIGLGLKVSQDRTDTFIVKWPGKTINVLRINFITWRRENIHILIF